ncbi:metal homeostatis protein bsd2 [Tremella mesenterica]|uniref:Metal homeostatis protein bsd2 n=1 Tax=Tremella mesenterica TaxID=5217 RepID=A0A4Q1BI03_TREME|nr:metal homeostatis protein bsd2 [Tremella mesenterica]
MPNPAEMDAAFDGPDDDEGQESHTLLPQNGHMPGDYDFERDYTLPPPSPPPFEEYSAQNPAPGNTNGIVSTGPIVRPNPQQHRHFLGGILPTSILPRQASPTPGSRVLGGGQSGVFSNLSARPNLDTAAVREGPEWVPENEQKDGPPSYQAALRDAVPPYWDTTVVLPSNNSPFGPLTSSMSGDDILIDGMPSGNLFGFFWNLIVSVSFQFVGFLLTYVLHTTHAAKYGSRVGLGITLIQFGLNLRTKAMDLINSGKFPYDPSDPAPPSGASEDEIAAEQAINAFWGPGSPWPATLRDPDGPPDAPPIILHDAHEAELWAQAHNRSLTDMLGLPSATDVGRANEWFSFMLMSIGWFLVLTSLGGWWRVKRFERGLRQAQRESEAAQAAANRDEDEPISTRIENEAMERSQDLPGPRSLSYYTAAFREAWDGARDLHRGFLGHYGRRGRGEGHAPVSQNDDGDHELLEAQGFGLEPMANEEGRPRSRGLWGF